MFTEDGQKEMKGFDIENETVISFNDVVKEVAVPSGVKKIGDYAFAEAHIVEKVTLPEGITELGDSAFYGCKSLKEIVLPSSLIKIGDCAFESCMGLNRIAVPEGVKTIGRAAFFCSGVTEIYLPSTVTMIMSSAFGNEKKYTPVPMRVHYNGTREDWEKIFISADGNEALRRSEILFEKK